MPHKPKCPAIRAENSVILPVHLSHGKRELHLGSTLTARQNSTSDPDSACEQDEQEKRIARTGVYTWPGLKW